MSNNIELSDIVDHYDEVKNNQEQIESQTQTEIKSELPFKSTEKLSKLEWRYEPRFLDEIFKIINDSLDNTKMLYDLIEENAEEMEEEFNLKVVECMKIEDFAEMAAQLLKWKCRYVIDAEKWYYADKGYWQPDNFNAKVTEYLNKLTGFLLDFYLGAFTLSKTNSEHKISAEAVLYRKIALKLRDVKNQKKIINEMAKINSLYLKDFNIDAHFLNCSNCTINLKANQTQPHDAKLLLINSTGVDIIPGVICTEWEDFIRKISMTEENRKFLQKVTGYFLVGDIFFERLFVFQGKTNHKNIFLETLIRMLGNYVITLEPEALSHKKYNNMIDFRKLNSVRFININELPKEMKIDSALLNRLINGSTMPANNKCKNSVEIKPKCKIVITTNYLPQISDTNIFDSGKINIIRLHVNKQETDNNKELKNFFQQPENLSGILNWALEGLELLKKEGLEAPMDILNSTIEYRDNNDIIGSFITHCLEKTNANHKEQTSRVYGQYKAWCDENDYYYDYSQKFWSEMDDRIRRTRSNKGNVIWGYKIISNYPDYKSLDLINDDSDALLESNNTDDNLYPEFIKLLEMKVLYNGVSPI